MKLGCVLFDLLLYVDVPALVMEQFDRAAVFGCAAIVQAPQWMKHRWDEWLSRRRAGFSQTTSPISGRRKRSYKSVTRRDQTFKNQIRNRAQFEVDENGSVNAISNLVRGS